jgi:hypothetical protein
MTRGLLVRVALVAAILGPSCTPDCKSAGCYSGILVELAERRLADAAAITVCVVNKCVTVPVTMASVLVMVPDVPSFGPHETTIDLSSTSGEATRLFSGQLEYRRQQPNGKGCQPVCYFARYSDQ